MAITKKSTDNKRCKAYDGKGPSDSGGGTVSWRGHCGEQHGGSVKQQPGLFVTRDLFMEYKFSVDWGWERWFQDDSSAWHLLWLYFYYYISSTSDHQALLYPWGWRPCIKKLTEPLHYLAILLLDIHLEENKIGDDACTPVLSAAPYTRAKARKEHKCSSAEGWIQTMW